MPSYPIQQMICIYLRHAQPKCQEIMNRRTLAPLISMQQLNTMQRTLISRVRTISFHTLHKGHDSAMPKHINIINLLISYDENKISYRCNEITEMIRESSITMRKYYGCSRWVERGTVITHHPMTVSEYMHATEQLLRNGKSKTDTLLALHCVKET